MNGLCQNDYSQAQMAEFADLPHKHIDLKIKRSWTEWNTAILYTVDSKNQAK